jgi:hypothetical protein
MDRGIVPMADAAHLRRGTIDFDLFEIEAPDSLDIGLPLPGAAAAIRRARSFVR